MVIILKRILCMICFETTFQNNVIKYTSIMVPVIGATTPPCGRDASIVSITNLGRSNCT